MHYISTTGNLSLLSTSNNGAAKAFLCEMFKLAGDGSSCSNKLTFLLSRIHQLLFPPVFCRPLHALQFCNPFWMSMPQKILRIERINDIPHQVHILWFDCNTFAMSSHSLTKISLTKDGRGTSSQKTTSKHAQYTFGVLLMHPVPT